MESQLTEQKEICRSIIDVGKLLFEEKEVQAGQFTDRLKTAAQLFIKLKSNNRAIFSNLEDLRKVVDAEKDKVDKLLLFCENLKYKQSYLRKQIRTCKDLSTPTLNKVEKEMNIVIGTSSFQTDEELQSLHEIAMDKLNQEIIERKELQNTHTTLENTYQIQLEKLDKKRKFLDELPTRISLVKGATTDLQSQFSTAMIDVQLNITDTEHLHKKQEC